MRQVSGTTGMSYLVSDDELGSGGGGKLYRCTDTRGTERAYKEYHKAGGQETAARLSGLQATGRTIVESAERSRTLGASPSSSINWPIDLVRDRGGRVLGVVLPLIPAQFLRSPRPARSLDFLTLARSDPPDAEVRVGVLIRLCNILGYLESRQLVHGDITAKNIVWHAEPPQAYLIDCDGLHPFDPAPTTGMGTAEWQDPRLTSKEIPAHDRYSDRFALALALYRGLFLNPGGPKYKDGGSWVKPTGFSPGLDPELRRLFGRALDDPRATDTRPTAHEWIAALTRAFISGNGYRQPALAELDAYAQLRRDEHRNTAQQTVAGPAAPARTTAPGHARTPQTLVVPQGTRPAPQAATQTTTRAAQQTPHQLHLRPQRPPPPSRRGSIAVWVLVPLLLLVAVSAGTAWWQHRRQQAVKETSAATACPAAVTSRLPADRQEGAVLLHHYLTRLHDITLCETSEGDVFYHGEMRGKPSLGTITLPARRTATGYVARNKGFTYTIHGSQVMVERPKGKDMSYALLPAD
ncbi:hypothetical protein [Streptomyces cyaneofuscatus]|uniref:hypothetical protein n=1 Tax=Streptomyces cyaneofuscatus TaxID=66883 RepID=UPI0037ABA6C9